MANTKITVTDQMKDWVKARVESGEFPSMSACIRNMIERDMARQVNVQHEDGLVTVER